MNRLTKTGWPRPIVNGWPIPWISPSDSLSTVNEARHAAAASGAVCGVCGDSFADVEVAWIFVRKETITIPLEAGVFRPMDNSVLHKRCAQLALKWCPKLKQMRADGTLQIVATGGNLCDLSFDEKKGGPYGLIPGKYCVLVDAIDDSLDGWNPNAKDEDHDRA